MHNHPKEGCLLDVYMLLLCQKKQFSCIWYLGMVMTSTSWRNFNRRIQSTKNSVLSKCFQWWKNPSSNHSWKLELHLIVIQKKGMFKIDLQSFHNILFSFLNFNLRNTINIKFWFHIWFSLDIFWGFNLWFQFILHFYKVCNLDPCVLNPFIQIIQCGFGCFQLLDLIIKELKSHMTCYNSMPLIGWNYSIQTREQIL